MTRADLRHSHVAYLINKGIEPLLIKERVGHKDIRITLNTYGHLYPNQKRRVADLLDNEKGNSPDSGNCQGCDNWKISVINIHNTSIAEVSSTDNDFQKWRALWKKQKQNCS